MSATAAHSSNAPPTSTANADADATAAAIVAAIGSADTATPAGIPSAGGSIAASGIVDFTVSDCAPTATAIASAIATAIATCLTPPPSTDGTSPSTAVSSSSSLSSSASSSAALAAALKKCACCDRLLPDGDYSGAQLKVKGKRQCKVCVAGLQVFVKDPRPCDAAAIEEQRRAQHWLFTNVAECLSSPLESEQISGLCDLIDGLNDPIEPICSGADIGLNTRLVVGVLRVVLVQEAQTDQMRPHAIECVALLTKGSTLLAQLVAAGAIPILLQLLQWSEPPLEALETALSAIAVERIAYASRANCDALRAGGALAAMLPLVQPGMPVDLRPSLFPTLAGLMRGQPGRAAEMRAAVARLGSVLVDEAAPPELLDACLQTFNVALISVADDQPNSESWVESIMSAAPEVPQRLVDLLGNSDGSKVADTALVLMREMFCAETGELQQLFDGGLAQQLSALLGQTRTGKTNMARTAVELCMNASYTKAHALSLVESDPVVEQILALLATAQDEMLRLATTLFLNVLNNCDRETTQKLVDNHRTLPPLVTALRRAIRMADKGIIFDCLRSVARVLMVGDADAEHDDRGINPYIEPLDFQLGAFELVEPLQNHPNGTLAEEARRVYSYFIPNDCW